LLRDSLTNNRNRTKQFLSRSIQEGGSLGHSSIEDSVAALDLVKWFVLNKQEKPKTSAVAVRGGGRGGSSVTVTAKA
jgi:RNA exonuclease 1